MIDFNWLTERDKKVLEFLSHAKYVSTSQITQLFFEENYHDGSKNKYADIICRRRMKVIADNGLVKSFYRQANKDKIYTMQDVKLERIVTINQIQHSLELNDLFIEIHRHAKKNNHTIYDFYIEKPIQNKIIPDMILVYEIRHKAKIFFIEYDRGTETITRIRKKRKDYKTYFDKQYYLNEDWQVSNIKPDLWYITKSEKRAKNIERLGINATTNIKNVLNF